MREHLRREAINQGSNVVAFERTTNGRKLRIVKVANESRKPTDGCSILEPLKLKVLLEQQRSMKSFMTGNNILDELSHNVKGKLIADRESATIHSGLSVDRISESSLNGFVSEDSNSLESNGYASSLASSESDEQADVTFEELPVSNREQSSISLTQDYRPAGFLEFYKYFREQEILSELKLVSKHLPNGIYAFPSLESLQVWYGVIFVRTGPYSEGIFHFNLILNDDFPFSRPVFRLSSNVLHPQFQSNGILNLDPKFPNWRHGKNHIWEILHFAISTFENITTEKPVNDEATALLLNNEEKFEAMARSCVLDSLLIYQEQSFKTKEDRTGVENPFRCRILDDDHIAHTKVSLVNGLRDNCGPKNGGLVGWAKSRFTNFLHSGGFTTSDVLTDCSEVLEF